MWTTLFSLALAAAVCFSVAGRRAAKIYARGRKGSYDLVGADF